MKRQNSFQNKSKAVLYLVATPIGNLEEMTPRAIDVLKEADIIAAEDTRNTMRLLSHFDIHTKLIAHHEHNERNSSNGILELLKENKTVALVSDAGYPCISDPGSYLVKSVLEAGFDVIPISGANACINALVVSGLTVQPYTFIGFLDANDTKRKEQLKHLKEHPYTMVFYEAIHRIKKTLVDMEDIFGDRKICVGREITKKYEEFIRGRLSEVSAICEEFKGELVVVVEGYQKDEPDICMNTVCEKIETYINNGMSASAAIKQVSKELGISKNEVYSHYHQA